MTVITPQPETPIQSLPSAITPNAVLRPLVGLSLEALQALMKDLGQPRFRAEQLHHWLYVKCARDFESMHNLAKGFRDSLAEQFQVGVLKLVTQQTSSDGTVKYLFECPDGQRIESVLMHFTESGRYSLCVSTQVGCAVNCQFCATGQMGFKRNLTVAEIVDQYLFAQHLSGQEIRNIVFMGQGEPLLNMENLLPAIECLNTSAEVGMRHITVSTAGIVPGIDQLAAQQWPLVLALSLHAPTDDLRQSIMPITKRWSIAELMRAVRAYIGETGRRVTIEYTLMAGLNDQPEHADGLGALLRTLKCNINLIPYNPTSSDDRFQRPAMSKMQAFAARLERYGKKVTLRTTRGDDIAAACGQLANLNAV